jgi:hypothetical protein
VRLVPVLELAAFALFASILGIRVFWWLDGEWVLRHIARRCEIHDRPAPAIIRQLEAELGMAPSPSGGSLVESHYNPYLIGCGHSWCRTKRELRHSQ